MGRPTNQKCWACSLLTIAEARKLHDRATPCGYLGEHEGDGCWNNTTCPSRRSYYRKGRGRLAQRQGVIETVVVPIPAISYVVLHTYQDQVRQPQDDVVIHAMCTELWVGGQPIALTQPQHTFGLPPRSVKDYARQLLEALYQQYGQGRRIGFERFAREEQHSGSQCPIRQQYGQGRRIGFERFAREEQHSGSQCPIRPCLFHAEHLHGDRWGGES